MLPVLHLRSPPPTWRVKQGERITAGRKEDVYAAWWSTYDRYYVKQMGCFYWVKHHTSYYPVRTSKEHKMCRAACGKRCSGISTTARLSLTPGRCAHAILQSATAPIRYLMPI